MPGVGSMLGVAKRVGASESTEAIPGSGSTGTPFASASQPVAIGDSGGVLAMNAHTYEAQSIPGVGVSGPVTAFVRGEPQGWDAAVSGLCAFGGRMCGGVVWFIKFHACASHGSGAPRCGGAFEICRFFGGEIGMELERWRRTGVSIGWLRCSMNVHAYAAQSMLPRRSVEASTSFSGGGPAEVGAVSRPFGGRSCGGVVCFIKSHAYAEQSREARRSGSAIRSRESGVNAVMGCE